MPKRNIKISYEEPATQENQAITVKKPKKNSKEVKEVKTKEIPLHFEEVLEKIKEMRLTIASSAPVDLVGAECLPDRNVDVETFRFQTLISVMLSSQTKDEQTAIAFRRLQTHGLTIDNICATSEKEIDEMIKNVGFHNKKSVFIKKTAQILKDNYDGKVPSTLKELCDLPGVGSKMALITLHVGFGIIDGISVDTHVHRITNLLGWVKTDTPEKTRLDLQSWVPREHWGEINVTLVGFGQTVCSSIKPKCEECTIRDHCPIGRKFNRKNKD